MTVLTEGKNSFFLTTTARIVDEEKETAAWASKHIVTNPNIKWILGNYVEANNPNSNGHYWEYNNLRMSQPTITHSPMNIDHVPNNIVGTWVATEMMMPTDADSVVNPYIEALGAFWKFYFPETLKKVESAYEKGQLWISMEAVADSITCGSCTREFAFAGPYSPSYCEHIQSGEAYKQLNNSRFLGGALIIPPNRPGWKSADVKALAQLTTDEQKQELITAISQESPHLNPEEWENIMWAIQEKQFLVDKN